MTEKDSFRTQVQWSTAISLLRRWNDEYGYPVMPPDPHEDGECAQCDTVRFLLEIDHG